MNMDWETDRLIRHAALRWLADIKRTSPHPEILGREAVFPVPELGVEIRALSPQSGIWKPQQMQACLSLMSSVNHVYNDYFSKRAGVIAYKYRAQGGYNHSDNRSLRLAMEHRLPVLYFRGVDAGIYLVEVVLIIREAADKEGVLLQVVEDGDTPSVNSGEYAVADLPEIEMRHNTYEAQRRLHQAEFRRRVMRAYRSQCAVCRLKRETLLDAAHIIPDSRGGRAEVPNGLSLCRIHHGAYDQNILGIDPDYQIHINRDMLEERDGPMLKHGFQEMNEQLIHIPSRKRDQPDRDKLSERFDTYFNT